MRHVVQILDRAHAHSDCSPHFISIWLPFAALFWALLSCLPLRDGGLICMWKESKGTRVMSSAQFSAYMNNFSKCQSLISWGVGKEYNILGSNIIYMYPDPHALHLPGSSCTVYDFRITCLMLQILPAHNSFVSNPDLTSEINRSGFLSFLHIPHISKGNQFWRMSILYFVWQATAEILLCVVPFLLNNKPQLCVVTTESDQFLPAATSGAVRSTYCKY